MSRQSDYMRYRRTFGIIALALLLIVVSASLVFAADREQHSTEPLQLRPSIKVDGEQILFDDLFTNAGDLAEKFVANAPYPGRQLSLNPVAIAQIAARNGRVWHNSTGAKRILVKRSGRRLGQQELSELILMELAQRGYEQNYELLVSTGSAGIYVPTTGISMWTIEDLNFDPGSGRFVASILPFPGAPLAILRGRAWPTIKVPTLKQSIHAGELISASDLAWSDVRAARLGQKPILKFEDIVGKIATRTLQPNRVLQSRDVQVPHAVTKGEMITISYEMPGLRLTARGKVLANAGTGDVVRAVNLSSSRTIDVSITGPGQAVAITTSNLGG